MLPFCSGPISITSCLHKKRYQALPVIHIRTLGEPGNKAGLLLAYTEFYVKIIRAKNALAHCEVILVTQFLMLIKDTVFLLNEN